MTTWFYIGVTYTMDTFRISMATLRKQYLPPDTRRISEERTLEFLDMVVGLKPLTDQWDITPRLGVVWVHVRFTPVQDLMFIQSVDHIQTYSPFLGISVLSPRMLVAIASRFPRAWSCVSFASV